ncbi:MAG TPA: glycosyltransferase [Thermoanaerobaculia bacterium]|jgi:glycosyltransferase involved in cell wall biosynthesis|nr:glycosyltransferase [Thermoanaerobaculia bacterium]
MRILFCSQAAHTGGGVEAWMEALTSALLARGHEVHTALAKGRFHDPMRYAARHVVANPIEVDGADTSREVRIANLLRVFERVQPDIIIPVNLADALYAASYAKTKGPAWRLALCIHSQGEDRLEQVRSCAPFIDLAVSVSRRVTMQLEGIVPNVRHIPTGVPLPLAPPRKRERIEQIAYAGRLDDAEKRVLDLIPLMHELDGVTLHIAGRGPDEPRLREGLRGMPVVFHGDLSRAELYETFYPRIDAIVVFSPAEAGPIVAWEAMAHGVVPIVSDFIGREEEGVLRDRVFPVGDIAAAAMLIRESPPTRVELPSAYTLPVFEQSWQDALSTLTAMPTRRGPAAALPSLVSTGRLARLGLGLEGMARVRRLLGHHFEHHDPGSEWPH